MNCDQTDRLGALIKRKDQKSSHLRCFQKQIPVYHPAAKWVSLWPSRHVGNNLAKKKSTAHWLSYKLSHFTAKCYTKICFWKHTRREISNVVTESWFISDQRSPVWQFDCSSPAVTDSYVGDSSALMVVFLQLPWILANAIRNSTRRKRNMLFFPQILCLMHHCEDIVTVWANMTKSYFYRSYQLQLYTLAAHDSWVCHTCVKFAWGHL